jgi:hypothetical protein
MDLKREVEPLLRKHWEEIALDKDTVPLDPAWDTYARINAAGLYLAVTARVALDHVNEKMRYRLVGYSSYFLTPQLPHYKSQAVAESDIFFLDPAYRQGMNGYRLLKFCEHVIFNDLEYDQIVTRCKLGEHDLGPFLERLGYMPIERVYKLKKV